MNALATRRLSEASTGAPATSPKDAAALLVAHFRAYNDEFGRITRRAAEHFLSGDAVARENDAVARIELYEQRVAQALRALRAANLGIPEQLGAGASDFWVAATAAYAALIERLPDSDFYRTFYNSVTRDLFGTVGVNPSVEFCATHSGRASGSVPIRVYPAAARCSRPSPMCWPTCRSPRP
jgi:isocitrate dehydrogenase kinase/phosphatase